MLKRWFGKFLLLCCGLMILFVMTLTAFAAEETVMAENISGKKLVEKHSGFSSVNMLFDGREKEPGKFRDGAQITLVHKAGIGSLYLVFDAEYGSYTITDPDTQQTYIAGTNDFLHEFIDLEAAFGKAPARIKLSFENGDGILNELYAFTSGHVPDFVQKWEKPADGETDLVLFSTHGDDEQLFFAGLLPYYGVERGCRVQVVYMTGHRNMTMRRSHEMLDGLWSVGISAYPVFGEFGDYNTRSLAEAYQRYRQKGISEEDLLSFVVEQIRCFRPKVAVGHDLNGEYGHGMHMVYAELLCKAVEISMDPEAFPDSAAIYGVWDVPKTYLHLYPENPIIMDWDQPLQSFDGMTAFEVTKKLGFPCHASQQTYYSWYFSGKNAASEITEYSPCEFGLYRSTVGEDMQKNDFMENLTTYVQDAEEERREQEEAARRAEEEAARLAAEKVPEITEVQQEMIPTEPESAETERGNGILPVIAAAVLLLLLAALITKVMGERKR